MFKRDQNQFQKVFFWSKPISTYLPKSLTYHMAQWQQRSFPSRGLGFKSRVLFFFSIIYDFIGISQIVSALFLGLGIINIQVVLPPCNPVLPPMSSHHLQQLSFYQLPNPGPYFLLVHSSSPLVQVPSVCDGYGGWGSQVTWYLTTIPLLPFP